MHARTPARPHARTHAQTHAHTTTQRHTHTLRNEPLLLCQDLDKKIEAEQAARREAQDAITYKLDLLLKKVGEVAGEGPGVMASGFSCACPGDHANPKPWVQQQQQAPPIGREALENTPFPESTHTPQADSGMQFEAGEPVIVSALSSTQAMYNGKLGSIVWGPGSATLVVDGKVMQEKSSQLWHCQTHTHTLNFNWGMAVGLRRCG